MKKDVLLMAHLMRRAGFGEGLREINLRLLRDYDDVVDELIQSEDVEWMGDYMVRRFDDEASGMINPPGAARNWIYQMLTTKAPLREKVALFWHGIFATGTPKVINGRVLSDQIEMFRTFGLGKLDELLLQLGMNPAMIVWLDNQDNHKDAINENWGRELLELFSMGVGNYSEEDIKECARAFTGWSIGNKDYMMVRALRDSDWPYGRIAYHFEYNKGEHDFGSKTFLGQTGNFGGEDIIGIICQQESTARFISRHLYHFFVEDEPPVPSWAFIPPQNPRAIDFLVQAYFDSDHNIGEMLRALFKSDFFKSDSVRFEKVKGPTEFVVGLLRMTGEFDRPKREMLPVHQQIKWMGQELLNPPSVEGWHQGMEWIDTGALVERINFASEKFGDPDKSGIENIVGVIIERCGDEPDAVDLVDQCLWALGGMSVDLDTRLALRNLAGEDIDYHSRVRQILKSVVSSKEFQLA